MTFSPALHAQLQQIMAKLRERTIGSPLPATRVDTPVWQGEQ